MKCPKCSGRLVGTVEHMESVRLQVVSCQQCVLRKERPSPGEVSGKRAGSSPVSVAGIPIERLDPEEMGPPSAAERAGRNTEPTKGRPVDGLRSRGATQDMGASLSPRWKA